MTLFHYKLILALRDKRFTNISMNLRLMFCFLDKHLPSGMTTRRPGSCSNAATKNITLPETPVTSNTSMPRHHTQISLTLDMEHLEHVSAAATHITLPKIPVSPTHPCCHNTHYFTRDTSHLQHMDADHTKHYFTQYNCHQHINASVTNITFPEIPVISNK